MASGRTPVAKGSSVPPWPTFWALVSRLTRATTSVEVTPSPLSTTSQPLMGRPLRLRPRIVVPPRGGGAVVGGGGAHLLADQALEPGRVVEQLVGHEGEVGGVPQVHLARDHPRELPRRPLEPRRGLGAERPAELGRVDRGRAQVAADPDLAHRDAARGEVLVADLAAHQRLRDDVAHLLGDTELPLGGDGGGRGPVALAAAAATLLAHRVRATSST